MLRCFFVSTKNISLNNDLIIIEVDYYIMHKLKKKKKEKKRERI